MKSSDCSKPSTTYGIHLKSKYKSYSDTFITSAFRLNQTKSHIYSYFLIVFCFLDFSTRVYNSKFKSKDHFQLFFTSFASDFNRAKVKRLNLLQAMIFFFIIALPVQYILEKFLNDVVQHSIFRYDNETVSDCLAHCFSVITNIYLWFQLKAEVFRSFPSFIHLRFWRQNKRRYSPETIRRL